MNTKSRISGQPLSPDRISWRRDLVAVVFVTTLTFVLAGFLDLNEWLGAFLVPFESYQADELPVTILTMTIALAWFSWRRSRQVVEQSLLRLATQNALAESEQQYRALFMDNLSANILATIDGQVKLANPAAAQLFGFTSPEQLRECNLREFYADQLLWETHRKMALRGEKIEVPALQLKHRNGAAVQTVAKLSSRTSPSREQELHLYLTDITDFTLMQSELSDALEENRRLSQRSMQVQEEERRNLARELHDELGQSLNAIKVDAVMIRDRCQQFVEVQRSAQAIIDVSSQVYEVVRSLMRRLRPVALDELGLRSAVQYSVDQWQRRHPGARCEFEATGELDDLGEHVNITLYRLVQECLTNVAKHAQATQVSIALKDEGMAIRFNFEDNGCGFDPARRSQGLGLIGLRERVEALSGGFELNSAPGKGVRIQATIPSGKST